MSEENIRLRILESRSGDIEDLLSELNLGSCRVEKITREYGQPSSAVISMHRGTQIVIMLVTTAHSSWKHCALLAYIQLHRAVCGMCHVYTAAGGQTADLPLTVMLTKAD